jgi:hypothetical protein
MPSPFKQPWHFDKFRIDTEGEYVKIVGCFDGDWAEDIAVARQYVKDQAYNQQNYGHAANAASEGHKFEDAQNPDGNPDAKIFSKFNFDKQPGLCPAFERISAFLQFDTTVKYTQKFHDQLPNMQLMWHIDNLPGNPLKERVIDNPDFKYQEPNHLRFLIMLEEWEPGQIVQFGNIVYTQWKRGTAFAWEWSTLPHLTWNGSWSKRPALQLTGSATEATWDLVRNGSADKVYKI